MPSQSLTANRDATNSNVTVSRSIGNLVIGGDVQNTNVNVGEVQSLFTFANYPPRVVGEAGHGVFFGDLPPTVADPQENPITDNIEPIAQNGGTINARIAGNITNSIFTASVDGDPSQAVRASSSAPSPGNLVLPRGVINAKVEGTINNASNTLTTDPEQGILRADRSTGLMARSSRRRCTYAPFKSPTVYHNGQDSLKGLFKIDQSSVDYRIATKRRLRAKKAKKK